MDYERGLTIKVNNYLNNLNEKGLYELCLLLIANKDNRDFVLKQIEEWDKHTHG